MTETEYGIEFVPPHKNAGEAVWVPNLDMAQYLSKSAAAVVVTRQVEPWVRL